MTIDSSLFVCPSIFQNVLVNKNGQVLSNGQIFFYQDANRTTLKNIFEQTGPYGNYTYVALPNPLTLSAAGTTVDVNGNDVLVFFYPFDETNSGISQPYFIEVYDSLGTLQFTRSNFPFISEEEPIPPPIGGNFAQQNLIVNNRFWRNFGSFSLSSSSSFNIWSYQAGYGTNVYYSLLAPDQHDGFSMPDINYIKTSTVATETINFNKFASSLDPILKNDIQPEFYINHVCTGDTGTYLKAYQFPISLHLATLAGQPFTFTIQAMGAIALTAQIYAFNGSNNAAGTSITQIIETFTLTSNWQKFTFSGAFPPSLGLPTATTGDDAYYLQIVFASGQCNFSFTLPSIYLTPLPDVPTNYFLSYDQIDSVASTPRTGDVRISMNQFYPYGWVPMNDGLLSLSNSVAATATTPGSVRANTDSWPLFNMLWNYAKTYDTGSSFNPICQMWQNNAGTLTKTNFGSTALADFTASGPSKALQLTQMFGKVLIGSVPLTALLPTYATQSQGVTAASDGGGSPKIIFTLGTAIPIWVGQPIMFNFTAGGSLPANVVVNTIYYVTNPTGTTFKISSTYALAIAGTPDIAWGSAGANVYMIVNTTGVSVGEYAHTQLLAELAAHTHGIYDSGVGSNKGYTTPSSTLSTSSVLTTSTGSSTPFNILQPSTFMNIFIKL